MANFKGKTSFFGMSALFGLMASCMADDTSTVKHDHGKITRNVNPISWISHQELPFEFYSQVAKQVLPEDQLVEIREWSQEWLDRIDQSVRSKYPDQMQNTPKPKIALIGSPQLNAHISSYPFCYNVDIEIEGKTGEGEGYLFPNAKSVDIGPVSAVGGIRCNDMDKDVLSDYLDYFTAKNNSGCKVSKNDAGEFKLSECKDNVFVGSEVATVKKMVVFRVVPYVNLNVGLFDKLDSEESVLAVIAHELGHYYRAHSGAMSAEYNYFYKRSEFANTAYKPEPTDDLEINQLGYLLQRVGPINSSLGAIRPNIDGIKTDPVNFYAAGQIVQFLCSGENQANCPTECTTVTDAKNYGTKNIALKDGLGYYPFGKPGKHYNVDVVKAFDADLSACVEVVAENLALSQKEFSAVYSPAIWNLYPDKITDRFHKGLAGYPYLLKFEKAPVLALFKNFVENKPNIKDVAKTSYSNAWSKGLGWYTAEQEADDFSAEILNYIGANTKVAGQVYLNFLRKEENNQIDGSFGSVACKKLLENDLKDENNNDFFLPVGDLVDTHHSNCFRLYNVMREIEAHGYYSDGTNLEPNSFGAFDYVQQLARNFITGIPSNSSFRTETTPSSTSFLGDDGLDFKAHTLSCKFNHEAR